MCVCLTKSVCSMSTGEYGGGPSMPQGASCKMSGAGRQIWRDTIKWTPSSLAWRELRDKNKLENWAAKKKTEANECLLSLFQAQPDNLCLASRLSLLDHWLSLWVVKSFITLQANMIAQTLRVKCKLRLAKVQGKAFTVAPKDLVDSIKGSQLDLWSGGSRLFQEGPWEEAAGSCKHCLLGILPWMLLFWQLHLNYVGVLSSKHGFAQLVCNWFNWTPQLATGRWVMSALAPFSIVTMAKLAASLVCVTAIDIEKKKKSLKSCFQSHFSSLLWAVCVHFNSPFGLL